MLVLKYVAVFVTINDKDIKKSKEVQYKKVCMLLLHKYVNLNRSSKIFDEMYMFKFVWLRAHARVCLGPEYCSLKGIFAGNCSICHLKGALIMY